MIYLAKSPAPDPLFMKKLSLSKRLPKISSRQKTHSPNPKGAQKLRAIYLRKILFMQSADLPVL